MKNLRKVITIFCLLILYAYFINIYNFPNNIVVCSSDKLNYRLCPFLSLTGETDTNASENSYLTYDLSLSLGNIHLKNVELTIAENAKVVPIRKDDRT